ncbi:unnamed protein product [Bursaphelenchus okinawaensis]|uniref:Uncharacterized protein n=1 Tax=Bursaphelenchus okinawaensis TaxID=465554 RepID=A0A811LLF3_9BILA|nr:unnamed protein product [Bursaphelenchus okinawaensis]CAG9124555.1 unnamed protein product [Bursaphelenchus okinawaensis]
MSSDTNQKITTLCVSLATTIFGALAWIYLFVDYYTDSNYYESMGKQGYKFYFFLPVSVQRSMMYVECIFLFCGMQLFFGVLFRIWILYIPYMIWAMVRLPTYLVGSVSCMTVGFIDLTESRFPTNLYTPTFNSTKTMTSINRGIQNSPSFQFFTACFMFIYIILTSFMFKVVYDDYTIVRASGLSVKQKKFIRKVSEFTGGK